MMRRSFLARLLLVALTVTVVAPSADAAIAVAQTIKKQIASATSGTTTGVTTTNGSTFVVLTADPATALTVSDSKGNTWSQAGSDYLAATVTGQIWYVCNGTGGASHTFTVTSSGGNMDSAFYVYELTGTAASCYDSGASTNTADAASPFTATSNTLAQANNAVISFIWSNGATVSWAATVGVTKNQDEPNSGLYWTNAVGSAITSATTAVSTSWNDGGGGGSTGQMIVAFKEASGGGGTCVNPIGGGGGAACRPVAFLDVPLSDFCDFPLESQTRTIADVVAAANDDVFLLRASR